MNRIASLALAGVIAAGSITATVATADAGGYWHGPRYAYGPGPGWAPRYHHHHGGGYWGGAIAGGAILGLALGTALASEPPPPPPPPAYAYYPPPPPPAYAYAPQLSQAHVDWCAETYRSYRPETDTFTGYDGQIYRCVGPY